MHFRIRTSFALLLLIASVFPLAAQESSPHQKAVVIIRDLPPWPGDGNTAAFPNQYVFEERGTGNLVVSYPTNLGAVDTAAIPGQQITFRVRLPIHVRPLVGVRVRELPDGNYEYTYRVRNEESAPDAITSWHLDVPTLAGLQIIDPPQWQHSTSARVPGTENLRSGFPGSHFIHWSVSNLPENGASGGLIPAGSFVGGFQIISRSRPGFLTAYAQGGAVIPESDPALPPEVKRQLDLATSIVRASRPAAILGPKFTPDTNLIETVMSFLLDVRLLINRKALDSDSPFTQDLQGVLSNYLHALSDFHGPVSEFVGPPLAMHQEPNGPLESEVALAFRLAVISTANEKPNAMALDPGKTLHEQQDEVLQRDMQAVRQAPRSAFPGSPETELAQTISNLAQSNLALINPKPNLADWARLHPDEKLESANYGLEYEGQGMWCARAVAREELPAGAQLTAYSLFYPPVSKSEKLLPLPAKIDESLVQRGCKLSAFWLEIRNMADVNDLASTVSRDLSTAWGAPDTALVGSPRGWGAMWGSGRWTAVFTWRIGDKNVWIADDPLGLPTGVETYEGPRLLVLIWDDQGSFAPSSSVEEYGMNERMIPASEPSVAEESARFAAIDPALTKEILQPHIASPPQPRPETDAAQSLKRWLQAAATLPAERRAAALVLAEEYARSLGLNDEKPDNEDYLNQAQQLASGGRAAELLAVARAENVCSFENSDDWRDRFIPYGRKFLHDFPASEWTPYIHYLLARTYSAKLMLAFPGNQEGQPTGANTPGAIRLRQSAITHYRAFLAAKPADPQAAFAWRETWRLLAGLPPTEIHFLCYYE